MNKKPIAILVAVLLVVTMAGCSGSSSTSGKNPFLFLTPTPTKSANTATPFPVLTATAVPTATVSLSTPTPSGIISADQELSSQQILEYFLQVGVDARDGHVKKWTVPIKVQILGNYTSQDYNRIIDQLDMFNDIALLPAITVVKSGGNFFIHFVPENQMSKVIPQYEAGYSAYYYCYWNDNYQLTKYIVTIASDTLNQSERNSITLRMLMRGLGFYNTGTIYSDSILYTGWPTILQLPDIDYYILEVLYNKAVKAGMTGQEVINALTQ